VERREEWARSWVRLFEKTGKDNWTLVPNSMIYQLEDPYISVIGDLLVLGGTHVRYKVGDVDTYYGYFYKGTDINDLYYFTTGPNYMKDIRLLKLIDGRVGVFSRPRNAEIHKQFGSQSQIGFAVINNLEELTGDVIEQALYISDLFSDDEWGGCNQAYQLDSGMIGVIGHICYNDPNTAGVIVQVYMNFAFVFDPVKHKVIDQKIIGTRTCYPDGPYKRPNISDTAFTSGIVMRLDGKADLYSGIGDVEEGRATIDYPFEGYGKIIG
jgi:hypothetical protein